MSDYRARREKYLHIESAAESNSDRIARVRSLLNSKVLCEYQVAPVLREYGILPIEAQLATSADLAIAIVRTMAHAVALKVQSPDILHKTDVGAVALDVRGTDAIRRVYLQLLNSVQLRAPQATIHGVLVQRMAGPGIEMIVGIRRDKLFGPMLLIGFGGVQVEMSRDVVLSPVPVTADEANELLGRLRGKRLLDGIRGARASDLPALIDLIVRLSQLAWEQGDIIDELELNPIIVHEQGQGVSVVDALAMTPIDVAS
jgi:acetate---CoA ligase (ADP-forming)